MIPLATLEDYRALAEWIASLGTKSAIARFEPVKLTRVVVPPHPSVSSKGKIERVDGYTYERRSRGKKPQIKKFTPASTVEAISVERVLKSAGIQVVHERGYDSWGAVVRGPLEELRGMEPVRVRWRSSFYNFNSDRFPSEKAEKDIVKALTDAGYKAELKVPLNQFARNEIRVTGGPVPKIFGTSFDTKVEADQWGQFTQDWINRATLEQRKALGKYTVYVGINAHLRKGGLTDEEKQTLAGLDALYKGNPAASFTEDVTLYRSWVGRGPNKSVGATFTDKAFTSTAMAREEAESFQKSYEMEWEIKTKPTMVRIDVPAGTRALYLGVVPEQTEAGLQLDQTLVGDSKGDGWFADNSEVLLDRGTKFEVVGFDADGTVHLKVVGQRAQK